MTSQRIICTFYVNQFFFGIDVYKIQEVIRHQEMTHVPLTTEIISGLINMRGQIVTAIDMRKRLDFPLLKNEEKPINIIIRTEDGPVSLLVDSIGDVIELTSDAFEVPPENLKGDFHHLLKEVCQLDKQLLLILDIDNLLTFDA